MRPVVGDAAMRHRNGNADLGSAMPLLVRAGAAAVLALAVFAGSFAVGRADDDGGGARVGAVATRLPADLRPSAVRPLGSAEPLPQLAAGGFSAEGQASRAGLSQGQGAGSSAPPRPDAPGAAAPQEPQGSPPTEAVEAP